MIAETENRLLLAAIDYMRAGFHVIPCEPRGKRPLCQWKEYQNVAADEKQIREWWELTWPDANIAVILGGGHIAVDVDGAEGHSALKAAGIEFPPDTPTSLTGRGVHYLLKGRSDDRIGFLPKVDIRGKGIIVVPPSVHASGKVYTWLVPPTSPPEAPRSLQRLLDTPWDFDWESGTVQAPLLTGSDWVTEAMQGVGEGIRNVTCTRLAGYFLAKGVAPDAVKALLTGWAAKCRPPLPFAEVMQSVDSIAQKEGPHHDEPKSLFDNLLTVAQLYDTTPEQHEWVVEDYIPRGALVMVASEEKVGKSTFMGAMTAAAAKGMPFLGRKVTQCPVLVLAVEEHPTDVKMRAMKFGLTPDDPVRYFVGDLPPDQATYQELADVIRSMNAGLVILDTLGHQLADILESENDSMGALKAVKPWLHLARTTNAAVVIIHHTGKSGAAYRGSSAFGGVVDQILTLRHGGGFVRYIETRGRYWSTPRYVTIRLDGTEYHVI